MTGPCLCGDPFCGSCGDPSLAKYEAWEEHHCEKLAELKLSEEECGFLDEVIPKIIEAHRDAVRATFDRAEADQAEALFFASKARIEEKSNER